MVGFALVASAGPVPVLADDTFNPLGDGSATNNADLLRDPTTGCENCAPNPPSEWNDPPFDVDWSLALRGSFVQTPTGSYFSASALPSVSLTHEFLRGSYQVSASAEVIRSTIEDFRVGNVEAGISGTYRLDELTELAGSAGFSFTRESAATVGVPPTVLRQPLTFNGEAEASATHDFGPFVVTARANASRTMYEPTLLVGPVVQDNSHQNNWQAGAGLRVGYRVTPILTAFVDGSAGYQTYDAPSPTYLVKLDAADLEGRVGLAAGWGEILEAEASVGYGMRRFADPVLGSAAAMLYDASVTFRPDETVELKGTLGTSFDAAGVDSVGTARVEHAAAADLRYRVNPWLTLRASASGYLARLVGTTETERGIGVGIGADYVLNEYTTLTADYGYAWDEATPDPAEDQHRVTLGITVSR